MRRAVGVVMVGALALLFGDGVITRIAAQENSHRMLRVRTLRQDPDLPARQFERLEQLHDGVKIWGGDLVRNVERGVAIATYGAVAPDLTLSVTPAINPTDAARLLGEAGGGALMTKLELVVLPVPDGGFALAYTAVVATNDVFRIFIDAQTGKELWRYSALYRQSAVGTGPGVLGDTKKLSVLQQQGAFVTSDTHRPPVINTYDMRYDLTRTKLVLLGLSPLSSADLARDADNVWTAPAAFSFDAAPSTVVPKSSIAMVNHPLPGGEQALSRRGVPSSLIISCVANHRAAA